MSIKFPQIEDKTDNIMALNISMRGVSMVPSTFEYVTQEITFNMTNAEAEIFGGTGSILVADRI